MKDQNGNMKPTSLLGMGLIILAVLLFLNNVGFRLVGALFSHWPLIMIAAGGYLLVARSEGKIHQYRKAGMLPVMLLVVGLLAASGRYGLFHFHLGAVVGPAILLLIGLYLFNKSHSSDSNTKIDVQLEYEPADNESIEEGTDRDDDIAEAESDGRSQHFKKSEKTTIEDDKIDVFAILGGGNYVTRSNTLLEGNVICVMGGAEIDLRDADMKNASMEIDLIAFMGGAELRVPPHWEVSVKAIPFLGGVSNKSVCLADKMGVPKKHLVITGIACMGGLEVKN